MSEYIVVTILLSTLLDYSLCTGSRCSLPGVWSGEYFHHGYSRPLLLNNSSITEKGECVWSSGSQYVFKSEEGGEQCWRCLSIFRKHHNVLQYKESDCEYAAQMSSYAGLCSDIAGDAPMHSMFRRKAEPTECPIKGPFMFSYAKGGTGRACSFPKSYMDTCKDRNRLQLHFQACTDVRGSESTTEEVRCLANWDEGSKSYFVGELANEHVYTDERRYRCYVYERIGKGMNRTVRMAQGAAATCSGLWTPTEGYRVFHMERVYGSGVRCEFPSWLSLHHSWAGLSNNLHLHINKGERSFKLRVEDNWSGREVETKFTCQQIVAQSSSSVQVVHYVKSECDSGYVCAVFNRVAANVVSVQFGERARDPSEACTDMYFNKQTSHLIMSRSHVPTSCPLNGRYSLEYAVNADVPLAFSRCGDGGPARSVITAGCGSAHLKVESLCLDASNITVTNYQCQASWTQPGLTHVLLSERGGVGQVLCLTYSDRHGWVTSNDCSVAGLSPQFLLAETGPCLQALSSVSRAAIPTSTASLHGVILFISVIVILLSPPT